jgi:hypothetical protein
MAEINKSGTPSLSTVLPPASNKLNGVAGEALAAGDACYVKASDGRVYRSSGAAANAAAKVRGFAAAPTGVGEAVTLLFGVNFRYGAGLTPGADLYLSAATPGGLADAATTGGVAPVGFVVDATRVHVFQSRY